MSATLQHSNDNVGEFTGSIATTITIGAAGNDRAVFVGCGLEFTGTTGDTPSDVTINGVSILSNLIAASTGATFRVAWGYYALEADLPAAAGTYDVVATFTGGVHTNKEVEGIAVDYFTGVNQANGLITSDEDNSASNVGAGGVLLTPTSSDYLIWGFVLSGGTAALTWGSPSGVLKSNESFNAEGGLSTAYAGGTAGGAQSLAWTTTAMRYGMVGGMFDVAAASGVTGSISENCAGDTLAASGNVGPKGSASENLSDDTLSSSGTVGSLAGSVSVVEIAHWEGVPIADADVTVVSGGEHASFITFCGDVDAVPSTSAPFTVTVDGNAATQITGGDNTSSPSQLTTAFGYTGSMTAGVKACTLDWGNAFGRRGFNVLLKGDSGAVTFPISSLLFQGNWASDLTGTISSLEVGDKIIFYGGINGAVGANNVSDNTGDVSVTNSSLLTSMTEFVGIATATGTTFDYDFSQAGASDRATLAYAIARAAGGGPSGITGSVSTTAQNDTLSASGIIGTPVTITDVDTNEIIDEGQSNVAVTGTGFEAVQGTGTMAFGSVTQALGASGWSDTLIHFDHAVDSTKYGLQPFTVTNDSGEFDTLAITVNPPAGIKATTLTTVVDSNITAVGSLAIGNQVRYSAVTAINGFLVTINSDGIIIIDKEGSGASLDGDSIQVGAWDDTTEDWGSYATQTLFEPVAGSVSETTTNDSLSASGSVAVGVTGSVNEALTGDGLSATAVISAEGSFGSVAQSDSLTATGIVGVAVTGSSAEVTEDASLSSSAFAGIFGSVVESLAGATIAAFGSLSVRGSLSAGTGDDSVTASAVVTVDGSVSITIGSDALSAFGAVGAGIFGSLSENTQAASIVASGFIGSAVIGSLSENTTADAVAASTTVSVNGAASLTLASGTLSATGLIGNVVSGNVNSTTDDVVVVAQAVITISAQASITTGSDALAALSSLSVFGSVASSAAADTVAATTLVGNGVFGSVVGNISPATVTSTGKVSVVGSANSILQNNVVTVVSFASAFDPGVVLVSSLKSPKVLVSSFLSNPETYRKGIKGPR